MNTAFRLAVKEAMDNKRTNPSRVAKEIGTMPSYVIEVLKGQKRLNETMEEKLCTVLGIEAKYVIKEGES